MNASGSVRLGEIIKIFCNRGIRNKILPGQFGIGVLVIRFSWIGALKKHATLIFESNHLEQFAD